MTKRRGTHGLRRDENGKPIFGHKYPILKEQMTEFATIENSQLFTTSSGTTGPDVTTKVHAKFEWMSSFNNPGFRYRAEYPRRDFGGEMLKYTISVQKPLGEALYAWNKPTSSSIQEFRGRISANPDIPSITSKIIGDASGTVIAADQIWFQGKCPPKWTDLYLDSQGAVAISIVKPTNPVAEMATALGDLYRDGLPALPTRTEGKRTSEGKLNGNIGSEYLNLVFGWSPTIKDGKDFIKAIRNYDHIVTQYERDNKRLIRRGFTFDEKRDTTVSVVPVTTPGVWGAVGPNGNQISQGKRVTYTTTVEKTWFSGVFSYDLDKACVGKTIAELDHLYGVVPDEETLWNLTPWSWLADWFTNTGNVLGNMDAFALYGLVMPWGYIMHEVTTTVNTTWEGTYKQGTKVIPLFLKDSVVFKTQQRRQATPYGFGISWDGLNASQIAILAALGISRV
jgi:hypothetical protein